MLKLHLLALLTRASLAAAAAAAAIADPNVPGRACHRGFCSASSFDLDLAEFPDWMSKIRDDTPLTRLSIPGTHDTMAKDFAEFAAADEALPADEARALLQCQNRGLGEQLRAGVRYVDVRARQRGRAGELGIYHDFGYTGHTLQDVLLVAYEFLERNPGEAVVMRLKKEKERVPLPGEDDEDKGAARERTFEEAVRYHLFESSITAKYADKHIYRYDASAPPPTLGQVRGKIVIIQNFPADDGNASKYGPAWGGPLMVLSDQWEEIDVSRKWGFVRPAIDAAAEDDRKNPGANRAFYLTHLSASGGREGGPDGLPIRIAAGSPDGSSKGMNDLTAEYLRYLLETYCQVGRIGIIIGDYYGTLLIKSILDGNIPFRKENVVINGI